jgi:hypothetical protein
MNRMQIVATHTGYPQKTFLKVDGVESRRREQAARAGGESRRREQAARAGGESRRKRSSSRHRR